MVKEISLRYLLSLALVAILLKQSRTVCSILVEGIMRNIYVKLY